MINQELLNYIISQQNQNIPDNAIKAALISSGWPEDQINENFPIRKKEPIQVTLVAIHFILASLAGVLIALGQLAAAFQGGSALNGWFQLIFILNVVLFLFVAIVLFKISSGLHKRLLDAYNAARIYSIAMVASSIVSIIATYINNKDDTGSFIIYSIVIAYYFLIIKLISDQRSFFDVQTLGKLRTFTIVSSILLILASFLTAIIVPVLEAKIYDDQRTNVIKKIAKTNMEPLEISWITYIDSKYKFALPIPEKWVQNAAVLKDGSYGYSVDPVQNMREYYEYSYLTVVVAPATGPNKESYDKLVLDAKNPKNPLKLKFETINGITWVGSQDSLLTEHNGNLFRVNMQTEYNEKAEKARTKNSAKMIQGFSFID